MNCGRTNDKKWTFISNERVFYDTNTTSFCRQRCFAALNRPQSVLLKVSIESVIIVAVKAVRKTRSPEM